MSMVLGHKSVLRTHCSLFHLNCHHSHRSHHIESYPSHNCLEHSDNVPPHNLPADLKKKQRSNMCMTGSLIQNLLFILLFYTITIEADLGNMGRKVNTLTKLVWYKSFSSLLWINDWLLLETDTFLQFWKMGLFITENMALSPIMN